MNQEKAKSLLVLLLRMMGIFSVMAAPAIFMPHSLMDWCHQLIGMGELPEAPIMTYLSRSLSAFYVFFGAVVLYVTRDLEKYLDFLVFCTKCGFVFAAVTLFIDITAKLPAWWIISEAGFLFSFFTVVSILLKKIRA